MVSGAAGGIQGQDGGRVEAVSKVYEGGGTCMYIAYIIISLSVAFSFIESYNHSRE